MAARTDSLLAHSIARSMLLAGADGSGAFDAIKAAPRAARVTAFVVLWATTMHELGIGDGELSPEVYAELGYDSRATTYRRLHDYAELWPEIEINEMGRLLLAASDARKLNGNVRVKLPVLAAA